jgi:hypothetical protein
MNPSGAEGSDINANRGIEVLKQTYRKLDKKKVRDKTSNQWNNMHQAQRRTDR